MPDVPRVWSLKNQSVGKVAEKAAKILRSGGVLVYPTDTIYGLGADPFQPAAVERVYRLKGRAFSKPIQVLIGERAMLDFLVEEIPPEAQKLTEVFWPGPLTLIFRAKKNLTGRFLGEGHTVGVRLPSHEFCRQLSLKLKGPVLSTSANVSGGGNPRSLGEIPREILTSVEAVVDGGTAQTALPSTILNVVGGSVQLVREGALPLEEIVQVVGDLKNTD